jgi:hypothetical protein
VDPLKELGLLHRFLKKYLHPKTPIHPQSNFVTVLLGIQTLAFMYNAFAIPLRVCFRVYQVYSVTFESRVTRFGDFFAHW